MPKVIGYDAEVSASSETGTAHEGPDVVRDVLQRVAAELLEHLDEMAGAVAEAILAADPVLAADTAIAVEMAASSRANVGRFLSSMATRPDEPLPTDVPPEALDLAPTAAVRTPPGRRGWRASCGLPNPRTFRRCSRVPPSWCSRSPTKCWRS